MTTSATALPLPPDFDALWLRLRTTEELGVNYLRDSLTDTERQPAALTVHTQLSNPADCSRRALGWAVSARQSDGLTWAVLRDRPVLGNRSQYAELSFVSTQTGVRPGEHGLVEMRLCRGTTPDDVPLRIRVENGAFYILAINLENVMAGDRATRCFVPTAGTVYTLSVLLFQKAVYARLTGADIPGGMITLTITDRRRFIPGLPGFALRPNPLATGGELAVRDWRVIPVGPAEPCRLAAIGDSITAGIDGEPEVESYVYLATRALGQELVLNVGSGGSTTALDLKRFPIEVAPFRPAITWIEGGTNDIGAGIEAAAIFENMMKQAALVTWGGRAVLSTVPPRSLPHTVRQETLAQLNRMIRESGLPFVDRHELVCDAADPTQIRAEYRHPDGVHVTRPAHAAIAAAAGRLFRSLI